MRAGIFLFFICNYLVSVEINARMLRMREIPLRHTLDIPHFYCPNHRYEDLIMMDRFGKSYCHLCVKYNMHGSVLFYAGTKIVRYWIY